MGCKGGKIVHQFEIGGKAKTGWKNPSLEIARKRKKT